MRSTRPGFRWSDRRSGFRSDEPSSPWFDQGTLQVQADRGCCRRGGGRWSPWGSPWARWSGSSKSTGSCSGSKTGRGSTNMGPGISFGNRRQGTCNTCRGRSSALCIGRGGGKGEPSQEGWEKNLFHEEDEESRRGRSGLRSGGLVGQVLLPSLL